MTGIPLYDEPSSHCVMLNSMVIMRLLFPFSGHFQGELSQTERKLKDGYIAIASSGIFVTTLSKLIEEN
jgi:hypothetical protein